MRRLALEAAVLLLAARAGLAFLPLRAVQAALRILSGLVPRAAVGNPGEIGRAVSAAGGRIPGSSCLPEALVGERMLLDRGLPADLRIGVQPPGGRLAAHAWVESDGRVIVGVVPDLVSFQALGTEGERLGRALGALLRREPVAWPGLGVSEQAFLGACDAHDLTGLVHRALAEDRRGWPESVVAAVGNQARAHAGLEAVSARETRRMLEALAAAGVRPLLFKGTALAYTVYPQPWLRPRNDTDLVIAPGHRDRARAALVAAGYEATNYSDGDELFRQFEMRRRDELGIVHAVDVHWAVSTQPVFAHVFDYAELAARAIPVAALGPHARALGAVDALLVACVHPAMHHQNEERLIWLYDSHVLATGLSAAEWGQFAALARAKAVGAICRDALTRAANRLGTGVPAFVLEELRQAAQRREPSAEYLRPGRRWGDELASSLGALGWRQRLRLLREVAFPPPRYLLAAYGLQRSRLGRALLPALYAHRGVHGMWKVVTGRK